MSQYDSFISQLHSLIGVLELEPTSRLYQDAIAVCDYLKDSLYRIAVFAPFNHGKSTLLNALLGTKTLPIDLIPTTGAAIIVGYGAELETTITLKNGSKLRETGTKILKQYAILDDDRKMKDEVAEVKVSYNHSWLKTGIEFLDLPGTNDREAQNNLVRNKLLSADLIIHVLDARKMMTLEERNHLKDWLQNRGITTVIFVVNFLNLLTHQEQQEVRNRLYFIAESFRSNLPSGISNIYCVDALPALRARIKGDLAQAQTTGITSLESALQNIVSLHQPNITKLPRALKIAQLLLDRAIIKQQQLIEEKAEQQKKAEQQIVIKQKAEKIIQQNFARSISDFRGWLYLPKLLANYQATSAISLQQAKFDFWLESEFKPDLANYQQTINKWVKQGCVFFAVTNPSLLSIDFPNTPIIEIPECVFDETSKNNSSKFNIPSELNFLLRKKTGAVIIGGASYVINKVATKLELADNQNKTRVTKISSQVYADAAAKYLQDFSDLANNILNEYEKIASEYITFNSPAIKLDNTTNNYQLQLLNNLINNLQDYLNQLTIHN